MNQLSKKHKTLLLTLLSFILLVIATIGIVVGVHRSSHDDNRKLSPSTHAILKSSCHSTRYPDLCYSVIASAPTHVVEKISNKKDVIVLSLNLTTTAVEHNFFNVEKLIKTRTNLTVREKYALHDCFETIDNTLDELRQAILDVEGYSNINNKKNKNNKSFKVYVDDVKTLLSSAITNQVTCLDGFSHSDADRHVRKALEKGQVHVQHMCSNALAMFKNMTDADMAGQVSKRRLYDWPRWMSSEDRRMLATAGPIEANVVVAADGSGDYQTVTEAVAAAPNRLSNKDKRYVIKIKAGVYRENVEVNRTQTNLMFVGEGRTKTIITGSRNVFDNCTTFHSATVAITGARFLARDLTFENTAGPSKHQAVALRVGADHAAFYRCGFLAYQDTLYVHNNRQFFVNCLIAGTIDFIFGNSAVVFQDCDIHARKPNPRQKNMVTAQSRIDPDQNTGIVIQKSRITGTQELLSVQGEYETYLGRPWKEYARTVVMQSMISDIIHPKGWHEWNGDFAIDTLYYAEYENTGPGSDTSNRREWKGVKVITDVAEAKQFTPREFIDGHDWLHSTSFPYSLGL